MEAIVAAGLSPLDEEELLGVWVVARGLMGLIRQLLDVLYFGIGPDDVKELLVVGDEVGGIEKVIPARLC